MAPVEELELLIFDTIFDTSETIKSNPKRAHIIALYLTTTQSLNKNTLQEKLSKLVNNKKSRK